MSKQDKDIAADLVRRDAQRLGRAGRALGDAFQAASWDQLGSAQLPADSENLLIALTLGHRGDLGARAIKDAAAMWRRARAQYPTAQFYVHLLGFDDDPREIPHVTEAAKFYRRWAREVGLDQPEAAMQHLGIVGTQLLAACGAFGKNWRDQMLANMPPAPRAS